MLHILVIYVRFNSKTLVFFWNFSGIFVVEG